MYLRTRPCSGPRWPLSTRRKRPALPPRRCAAAPVGTRYPSSGAPQPPCDWPGVPPPRRSAPRGSLSPWRSPLRTLPREKMQEDAGGGRAGDGRRVSIDCGPAESHLLSVLHATLIFLLMKCALSGSLILMSNS